jgi:hypothetical protein
VTDGNLKIHADEAYLRAVLKTCSKNVRHTSNSFCICKANFNTEV